MQYRWKGTKVEAIDGLLGLTSSLMDEVKTLRDALTDSPLDSPPDSNSSIVSILQTIANHVFGIPSLHEEQIRVMTQVLHHIDTVCFLSFYDC